MDAFGPSRRMTANAASSSSWRRVSRLGAFFGLPRWRLFTGIIVGEVTGVIYYQW